MGTLFFAVWFAVIVFSIAKAIDQRSKATTAWKLAAEELGLEHTPGNWVQRPSMCGQVGGLFVEVKEAQANKSTHTVYTVRLPAPIPEDLKLSAETFLTQVSAQLGKGDLQTGDEPFDAAVSIRGEDAEVLARLTQPARRALQSLIERGAKLESGRLELALKSQATEAIEILSAVKELVGAARLFHLDWISVPEALARNAAEDPEAQVRLRNLSMLFRDHPRTELARKAAAKALEDPEPAVRLRAAEFIPGTAASAVLKALVGSDEEPWVRVEALRILSRQCPYAEIADLVALALRAHEEEEMRQEAVRAIARGGDHSKVDALVAMVDGSPPMLAEALAEAFGQLGSPRAEEALLRLLTHASDGVRILAAQALGKIGTVRAVEPLLPLTRGLLGGELQESARDAVRRIQGRLGDVEAGALAVVDDQGGALSLPAEEGAVAVVEGDDATRERSGERNSS
ncbi:MAG TPA: HEAT repeat domain-containing protein [Myxococcaceae bacterium]|nr:HEAT repeat domain-containing protein [Myxococcaceae bacterium]